MAFDHRRLRGDRPERPVSDVKSDSSTSMFSRPAIELDAGGVYVQVASLKSIYISQVISLVPPSQERLA